MRALIRTCALVARSITLDYLEWYLEFLYPKYRLSSCWIMSNISLRIPKDKSELWKKKDAVTNIAVATTKSLFGMWDWTVDSDVGTGSFCSCWRFCTCVDTRTCDRTCLRGWADIIKTLMKIMLQLTTSQPCFAVKYILSWRKDHFEPWKIRIQIQTFLRESSPPSMLFRHQYILQRAHSARSLE